MDNTTNIHKEKEKEQKKMKNYNVTGKFIKAYEGYLFFTLYLYIFILCVLFYYLYIKY